MQTRLPLPKRLDSRIDLRGINFWRVCVLQETRTIRRTCDTACTARHWKNVGCRASPSRTFKQVSPPNQTCQTERCCPYRTIKSTPLSNRDIQKGFDPVWNRKVSYRTARFPFTPKFPFEPEGFFQTERLPDIKPKGFHPYQTEMFRPLSNRNSRPSALKPLS